MINEVLSSPWLHGYSFYWLHKSYTIKLTITIIISILCLTTRLVDPFEEALLLESPSNFLRAGFLYNSCLYHMLQMHYLLDSYQLLRCNNLIISVFSLHWSAQLGYFIITQYMISYVQHSSLLNSSFSAPFSTKLPWS